MSRSIYLHASRFRIVREGVSYRVYDAQTVSDADVRNGRRAEEIGSFPSVLVAKAFCHNLVAAGK